MNLPALPKTAISEETATSGFAKGKNKQPMLVSPEKARKVGPKMASLLLPGHSEGSYRGEKGQWGGGRSRGREILEEA